MFPGSFPNVRHNLFNTILVMDLSQSSNLHFIATTVANIVNRGLPFRFGVVPVIDDEDSESLVFLVDARQRFERRFENGENFLLHDSYLRKEEDLVIPQQRTSHQSFRYSYRNLLLDCRHQSPIWRSAQSCLIYCSPSSLWEFYPQPQRREQWDRSRSPNWNGAVRRYQDVCLIWQDIRERPWRTRCHAFEKNPGLYRQIGR